MIEKSNIHKRKKMTTANEDANIGIRQEWRHFKPKEKVFILKAIHTCTNAKDVSEVLLDFVNAADYVNKDRDFLIACLTACLQSKMTLGAKFKAAFRDVLCVLVTFVKFSFPVPLFYLPTFFHANDIATRKTVTLLLAHQVHG